MKYPALLLSLCACACCHGTSVNGNCPSEHCATDLPFASQLNEQTAEGKHTLQKLVNAGKYFDPTPATVEVWCNSTWNDNVVGPYCGRQVDDYCKKNCATGSLYTECTQEATRTKLTQRCANDSIVAFRVALPTCQALSVCGLSLKASCTKQ